MKVVSTKYGKMRVIKSDSIVSHALTMYGEWAVDELDLLHDIILPGMHVMDIGSFIGTHALAFASFVGPAGKVYAFEPRKEISEILAENMALNEYHNVVVHATGLGAKELSLNIQPVDLGNEQNFGSFSLVRDEVGTTENLTQIQITTVDALNFDRVDVMKLDVEGMEHEVLNGATETIKKNRPVIFCECNSVEAGHAVCEVAKGLGYEVLGFLAKAYNERNFNGEKQNIFGNAKELALLLLPFEKSGEILGKLSGHSLAPIRNLDDLALFLLHKPQYAYEVLAGTSAAAVLGLDFPSPALEKERHQFEASLQELKAVFQRKTEELGSAIELSEQALSDARQHIVDRDSRIQQLIDTANETQKACQKLKQDISDKEAELQQKSQKIEQQDTLIKRVTSSKSWILTKPIRWTSRVMRGDIRAAIDPFSRHLLSRLESQRPNSVLREVKPTCQVERSPVRRSNPIAIILPVYRGVDMTRRCILAALPGVQAVVDSRMVVINDGSPDQGMQEMLDSLGTEYPGVIKVLKNEQNLGFVGTVNRGFAYVEGSDTVLLNSDVIVPDNWLARLVDEAYSRSDIGTVTPLSNNGTICSFPNFLQENPQPFELDVNRIDEVFRQGILPCIQAPTGVGFCMYIRRECLDQIGYLNQERFGRGYGEENDLCQRAKAAGWMNIITPNLYAYHEGGVSFSSEKQALVERAMEVLEEMHPNYHRDVQLFIDADPVKSARVARCVQLLASMPIPKVLHVSHALGGGVTQHIRELPSYNNGTVNLLLTPSNENGEVHVHLGLNQYSDKLIFNVDQNFSEMSSFLKAIGINVIHFHHVLGLPSILFELGKELSVPHLLTIHDFYLLNANPTLTNEDGIYPGYYSSDQHNPLYPLPSNKTVAEWQATFRELVEHADQVIYPSNSTKAIFEQVYKPFNSIVAPHSESRLNVSNPLQPFKKKSVYTVGIIGAIGREKGADLLEEMAEEAQRTELPIKFKLIGYAYRPLKAVDATGPYEIENLKELIRRSDIDVAFFPARWPETYSYTLSYALDAGLPVFAPNLGAFPERVSGRRRTMLFAHKESASKLVKQLHQFLHQMEGGSHVCAPFFEPNESDFCFYDSQYKNLISRNICSVPPQQTMPFVIQSENIISGMSSRPNGWRNVLLRMLWSVYMNPTMRWVGRSIPFNVKRAVKRSLSRSSMHDIYNRH